MVFSEKIKSNKSTFSICISLPSFVDFYFCSVVPAWFANITSIYKSLQSLWTRIENLREISGKQRTSTSYQKQRSETKREMYQKLFVHFRKCGILPVKQSRQTPSKMETAVVCSQIFEKHDISNNSPIIVLQYENSNDTH